MFSCRRDLELKRIIITIIVIIVMMIKIGKSVKSLELRPFTNECSYRIAEADEDRDLLKGQTDKKKKKRKYSNANNEIQEKCRLLGTLFVGFWQFRLRIRYKKYIYL